MTDEDIVHRVRQGEHGLFEVLMRRYNQRLFRVARGIVRDDAEAEDVVQQAYLNAFLHLDQFAGRASFATWLTKIAVYEALRRARAGGGERRDVREDPTMTEHVEAPDRSPEAQAHDREMAVVLEAAVAALPSDFRVVFMLREVEGLSTRETAASLALSEDTVKTRLHRAKAKLRRDLAVRAGVSSPAIFSFQGDRCDRLVATVMRAVAAGGQPLG